MQIIKRPKKSFDVRKPKFLGIFAAFGVALVLAASLIILRAAAFKNAAVADCYAEKIFSPLASFWSRLTSLVPVSLTECAAVFGTLAAVFLLIRGIARLVIRPAWRWQRALRAVLVISTAALFMLSLFIAFHGINYARSPLAETLGITVKERAAGELEQAVRQLAAAACEAREGLPEDENGVLRIDRLSLLWKSSSEGWEKAGEKIPALRSPIRPVPKGVILSHYWSYTHIVGLYMPLLAEVNVNIDQPAFAIPATAAHELAHARGFAREDDSTLAAYISCFCHPDPVWRYSGLISAWKLLSNRLYAEDRDRWSAAYADLSSAVRRDLGAERAYWKEFETPVASISTTVNDAYLKANQVKSGVKSYGQAADILLAYMEAFGISLPSA